MHVIKLLAAWPVADQISLGAAVISLLALVLNIGVAIHSWRSSRTAQSEAKKVSEQSHALQKQSYLLAMGGSETEFMDKLNGIRHRGETLLAEIAPLAGKSRKLADDKRLIEAKMTEYNSVIEGYFNTLEVGCRRYLEGKWDKDTFRKTYRKDLRMWVEQRDNKAIYDLLHPREISHFTAIWEVFREWETDK
jgi:hypothetical protein